MSGGSGAAPAGRPDAARLRREVLLTTARSLLGVVSLLVFYGLLPDHVEPGEWAAGLAALTALAVFVAVFVRQLRRIRTSAYPVLRAVQALVLVATLFVVAVATVHVTLSAGDPGAYSEPLDRVDGIYFTVTVLATVGFGDISPLSATARVLTTLQMLLGVALLGAGVRLLFAVAREETDSRVADEG